MVELGEGILLRTRYAMQEMDQIAGVNAPLFSSPHFREFVVNFDDTGKSVAEVNQALLAREIFGGKDLSLEYPELGQSALYCITEVHTKADIDRLVVTLKEVVAA
jgi:glycine dehydrogenase subunit 1